MTAMQPTAIEHVQVGAEEVLAALLKVTSLKVTDIERERADLSLVQAEDKVLGLVPEELVRLKLTELAVLRDARSRMILTTQTEKELRAQLSFVGRVAEGVNGIFWALLVVRMPEIDANCRVKRDGTNDTVVVVQEPPRATMQFPWPIQPFGDPP